MPIYQVEDGWRIRNVRGKSKTKAEAKRRLKAIMANKSKDDKFSTSGKICKSDTGNQIIGGWFSVFKVDGEIVLDSDNEEVDIPSYNNACIEFAKNCRSANFDHQGGIRGTLIDNLLIDTPDMAKMLVHELTGLPLDEIPVKKLGHFGSFQIFDKEDYKDALKTKKMFSIEGTCERVEVKEDE